MHPSLNLSQGSAAHGVSRLGTSLILLVLGYWGITLLARAVPDIIRRIAQPCAGCYLGAFGPPLEPYGHPFRQSEDTATAGTTPPPAMTVQPSFTISRDPHFHLPLRACSPFGWHHRCPESVPGARMH